MASNIATEFLSGVIMVRDQLVEMVEMEVEVVVDVLEAAVNLESQILSLVLLPNPLDGGVTTEMID